MTRGGDGVGGFHHTDASKEKMSIAKAGANHPNYGTHLSEVTRSRISNRLRGLKHESRAGVPLSIETRQKMSEAKRKPVAMFMDDMVSLITTFDSAKTAELVTGVNRKNISLCCLGQRKHAGGYAWKFA